MKKTILILLTSIMIASAQVHAAGTAIGMKAGTLGLGLEAEQALSDVLSIRIGINYISYSYTGDQDDIDYDIDLELMTVPVLLDWHPFKGAFRISAGALYNDNSLKGEAVSDESYKIGDVEYSGSQLGILSGSVEFDDFGYYLGIGCDTSFGKEDCFGFTFDIGAMYHGEPVVTLAADGPVAGDPSFQRELDKERQSVQDDMSSYKLYPVIAIGMTYRF